MKRNTVDYILFITFLILLNLVGVRAFFRADLTSDNSFSLSPVSRQTLSALENPLNIKVFFTSNLPAPYNSVDRYLRDLLGEYKNAGKQNFSYEFIDMDKEENKKIAQSYGINAIQIQEVNNDELQVKTAFMGLAVQYGDSIDRLNNLTGTGGLEYRLTTTVQKMISLSRSLSDLGEPVKVHLYVTDALSEFKISGFNQIKQIVTEAVAAVNAVNPGTLELEISSPETVEEIEELKALYGAQDIRWEDKNGQPGQGVFDLILTLGDSFQPVDIPLRQGLFGNLGIEGLDTLEDRLNENIEALITDSLVIGYVTGHGEKDLNDAQMGAAVLNQLVSDMYTIQSIGTAEETIPEHINTLIINGPKQAFTEAELYKIDQYVMKGGRLMVFLDPYQEILPQQMQQMNMQQPLYLPLNTGLEKLLTNWNITPGTHYVLDTKSYKARQQGQGDIPLYYVPILERDTIGRDNGITDSLQNLIFLKTGYFEVDEKAEGISVLASSSKESWLTGDQVSLMPYTMSPPEAEQMKSYALAVLSEGSFTSYFSEAPAEEADDENSSSASDSTLSVNRHTAASLKESRIAVFGSSELTGSQVLSADNQNPNALLVRNTIDYLSDNEDMNEMRSKGSSTSALNPTDEAMRASIKTINMIGLPLLVLIAGIIVWQVRKRRREMIKALYSKQGGEV